MFHESEWFWGLGHVPTPEEADKIIARFDEVIHGDGAIVLMEYEQRSRVATMHLYIEPEMRRYAYAAYMIDEAVDIARAAGMQKIVAPLVMGNPFMRPGSKEKFGFKLEGVLRRHTFIAGEYRDVYYYARLFDLASN